ncbi:MAG: hypothetical protein HQK51_19460 [Oligoflexia bacterium]|nr:hypothetical protein [Oligoflexia bacterium]
MKDFLYLHNTYDSVDSNNCSTEIVNNERKEENKLFTLKDRTLADKKITVVKYKTEKFFLSVDIGNEQIIDLKNLLSEIEERLIEEILKISKGNKNKASKLLRINRTTLIEKMKKINMRKIV